MPRTKQFDEAEILEKAKNLFWKQGFHATSIQNLVDHLGINRASIYDTFGGKNQLYEATLLAYRKEGIDYLEKRLARFQSVKKSLQQLFLEAVQEDITGEGKGCFLVNCATEYLPKHTHILTDLLENKANFESVMTAALKRGIDNKEFDKSLNIREVATYLFTFFSGLRVISKMEKDQKAMKKVIEVGLEVLN